MSIFLSYYIHYQPFYIRLKQKSKEKLNKKAVLIRLNIKIRFL